MDDLKKIALELLEKYENEKLNMIHEVSGRIDTDEKKLKNEVEAYKKKIEESK